jgi:hypothetical protein
MTWCSVDSATPRFVLASSAIRCRFVDRFVRLKVLSRVSRQRFSPHGTPLPSIGSRRVRFPDVSGRIEVLRLPVTHPRSLICFASGVHATFLGSCLAACAPKRSEGAFWAGVNVTGDPIAGLLSRGRVRDLPGSQAIHPVPLPRSRTPAESTIPRLLTVSSMLPPLVRQRRLQRINHIGAIAGLQHLLPTLQERCCHHPCKAYFRPAGSPLPGGS